MLLESSQHSSGFVAHWGPRGGWIPPSGFEITRVISDLAGIIPSEERYILRHTLFKLVQVSLVGSLQASDFRFKTGPVPTYSRTVYALVVVCQRNLGCTLLHNSTG